MLQHLQGIDPPPFLATLVPLLILIAWNVCAVVRDFVERWQAALDEDRAEAAVDVGPAEPVEPDDPRNRDALAIDLIKALGGAAAACQCPACGQVMVKAGGNHEMMCGCEAKPGGQWNTVENALRGDGCGHPQPRDDEQATRRRSCVYRVPRDRRRAAAAAGVVGRPAGGPPAAGAL